MLKKKTIKSILLEVESSCYNYEKYLQEIIDEVLNDSSNDAKYLIVRGNDNGCLTLYKYSERMYTNWLYNNYYIDNEDIDNLINNYDVVREYVQKNYIDYYTSGSLTNFINIRKFRKSLYNNKALLKQVINNIYTNIRKYQDDKYRLNEYNLNKELYRELKKIHMEDKNNEYFKSQKNYK